jgi:hypothetical protein
MYDIELPLLIQLMLSLYDSALVTDSTFLQLVLYKLTLCVNIVFLCYVCFFSILYY